MPHASVMLAHSWMHTGRSAFGAFRAVYSSGDAVLGRPSCEQYRCSERASFGLDLIADELKTTIPPHRVQRHGALAGETLGPVLAARGNPRDACSSDCSGQMTLSAAVQDGTSSGAKRAYERRRGTVHAQRHEAKGQGECVHTRMGQSKRM